MAQILYDYLLDGDWSVIKALVRAHGYDAEALLIAAGKVDE